MRSEYTQNAENVTNYQEYFQGSGNLLDMEEEKKAPTTDLLDMPTTQQPAN
jgi:hypothetical protein